MNIYNKAINHFGHDQQHLKLIEEMAELTQAILKRTNVAEEISDVTIVLDQLKLIYPEWKTWEQIKLKRLEEKLSESR